MNESLEPKIRFKGFTDAWEQRKLGEHTNLITKGTTPRDKSGKGTVNFIKVENLNNGKILPTQNITQKEHQGYLKRSRLNANDILFSIAGTLGRTAVVHNSITPANTNQALAIIRGYDFNQGFLVASLSGNVVKEYIRKNPTVGAQPNLSLDQINKLVINTPSEVEQSKIGSLVSLFDNLITLNQSKLDQLKTTKKLLMQKVFDQEWRFNGFTDPWEQRKFESYFNFPVSSNSLSRSELNYQNGEVQSIHYGDILINYDAILDMNSDSVPFISNGTLQTYKDNLLLDGDIIFSDAAEDETVGKAVEVTKIENKNVVSGLHTIVARPKNKTGKYFWGYYINSNAYHEQLLRLIQGSKVSSLNKGNIKKSKIFYPTNLSEQEIIGVVFKKLDILITLNQQRLDQLKEIKKYLMQNMFI